ncbi:PREDICTED: cytochrome P450 2F5-like [Gekko japonicus]|uniref:Cytochrome P450 2F5-like n=1 Tax=Gekko japonicus TaxID=146911 RepID=A0ABM1JXA9_GEKJA|nr:PREDICTED: cytochrome P450 2F5-like [Gekko japonicus]
MELSGGWTLALLLAALSALLGLLAGQRRRRRKTGRLPAGPPPLPLLGNLLQLDPRAMHRSLEKLSQKYGPVYTIHLGSLPCVVLCGYQAVKEALVDQADDFSDRGEFPVFYRFTQGNGIAFSNGDKWKVLRRFALQTLKNFGMGRSSVEERIQEEAQCLVREFRKTGGAPFNPINLVCRAVSNVICSVVFGNRFDYEDADFLTLLDHFNENFKIMSSFWGELYNIFPRFMDLLPGPHQQIFRNFEKLRQFIAERVRRHQESIDPSDPRDFIDCFLIRMEQEKQDPLSHFHTETLVMTTHNLFFGGTETTSTTLRYSFLILMKYPEVAAQVHQEIDQVIGHERAPCLADRKLMPYTDAVIYEIQRFISILPMGLPRAVTRDTPFRDFLLPKGTNVIPLLSSVHYDPSQFKDPDSFNPANFLDEKNAFKSSDAFMPFAPGKRICLGAGLARMEIFLFLTTLLQHFAFRPLVAPAEIDLAPQCTGLGNIPPPFEFQVLPRQP